MAKQDPDQRMLVNGDRALYAMLRKVEDLYREHGYVEFSWQTGTQRTIKQNSALHLWLGWLAKTLNDAGLDQRKVLKPGVAIPWDTTSAKRYLWKPFQEYLIHIASTKDAKRPDYAKVEQHLTKHLQETFPGIEIPDWPDKKKMEAEKRARRAA